MSINKKNIREAPFTNKAVKIKRLIEDIIDAAFIHLNTNVV
jgi:hypothetical protein